MEERIYDSSVTGEEIVLKARYYNAIEPTSVFFKRENVTLFVDALGHIEFFDAEKNSLGFVERPVGKDPSAYAHSAQYGEVRCASDGKSITVFLPVYWWSDSYPHCDGESDRWTRHIDRWFRVVFHCKSRQIIVYEE